MDLIEHDPAGTVCACRYDSRAPYGAPLTDSTTTRIGTVDVPERVDREKYFRELTYLELSAMFAGPLKPSALAKWAAIAPPRSIGLVAPFVLTHRQPPKAARVWTHDTTSGDFRDSAPGRAALLQLREAVAVLQAVHVVFRSPPLFAPAAANRAQLQKFFSEVATEEALGVSRVWVPDGLWEPQVATRLATELGVIAAFDPLVRDPNAPPEIYENLDTPELYLRIAGLGRSGTIRSERMEDLVMLLEHYEDRSATIVFESPSRWADARNLKKLLERAGSS